jgi:hypothetical protein
VPTELETPTSGECWVFLSTVSADGVSASAIGDRWEPLRRQTLRGVLKTRQRSVASEARLRHWKGVSGRIDLGARLGPALTACIGVTARGVRASHA